MNIWHVFYDYEFRSSTGMESYTNKHDDNNDYILTVGDAVSDVVSEIEKSLGSQCVITHVSECTFMGRSKNTLELMNT